VTPTMKAPQPAKTQPVLPIEACKKDFPLFQTERGAALHYLDNAATTQKPAAVIEAISECYRSAYGPVHRGLYPLAEGATAAYEDAREIVSGFIGAATPETLIFTPSATDAINRVAWGWARPRLKAGDRIWVTRMEHHSNFLPWQRICAEKGAELKMIELRENGDLDLEGAEGLFDERTRLIALTQVSNVLGIENPIRSLCEGAAQANISVFVDGAQSVGHMPIDVQTLGCDFFAFSAHKMYGPNGIGALYGKMERLEEMTPMIVGGGMVDQVTAADCSWAPIPTRFEAGSPNLANAVGFAAAATYLSEIGLERIQSHVARLTQAAVEALSAYREIRLFPEARRSRNTIVSFDVEGIHPHDIAHLAGEDGVALRAGHHCCQPLMQGLDITGTVRASFGIYNRQADVDALLETINRARDLFS